MKRHRLLGHHFELGDCGSIELEPKEDRNQWLCRAGTQGRQELMAVQSWDPRRQKSVAPQSWDAGKAGVECQQAE